MSILISIAVNVIISLLWGFLLYLIIANWRKETVEESFAEEMERKRKTLYG